MDLLGVDRLDICPWALREGVILRRMDWLADRPAGGDRARPAVDRLAGPCAAGRRPVALGGMSAAVQVPGARVALSTASVYPEGCAAAFDLAARLGYDGVEVMVWTDPVSRRPGRCARWPSSRRTGRVRPRADAAADPAGLGPRPVGQGGPVAGAGRRRRAPTRWSSTRRSAGSATTPRSSSTGWRCASTSSGSRSRSRTCSRGGRGPRDAGLPAALGPGQPALRARDARPVAHRHRRLGRMAMAATLGHRLRHVHLADGTRLQPRTSTWSRAAARSRAPSCSRRWRSSGFDGHRRGRGRHPPARRRAEREADLAEALAFARLHLAAAPA